jgi:8-oxo-dGTP pyrophosphatase MutT (NUDIX family)
MFLFYNRCSSAYACECYRHIVDSIQIEVSSGYIDGGETPKEDAMRELSEETGYSA